MTFFDTTKVYTNTHPDCVYAWWCSATRCAHASQPSSSLYDGLVAFSNIMCHDCVTLAIADRHSFCLLPLHRRERLLQTSGLIWLIFRKPLPLTFPR